MEKFKLLLVASILLLVSVQSEAVIVGDKDWLQITKTVAFSWNDFDNIFDVSTGVCDVSECIVTSTGERANSPFDLTGYMWASNFEVNELLKSYTGGIGLSDLSTDNEVELALHTLDGFFLDFEFTHNNGLDFAGVHGLTRNQSDDSTKGDLITASTGTGVWGEYPDTLILDIDYWEVDWDSVFVGGWFYRPLVAIPAPSTQLLFLAGLVGLGIARRKMEKIGEGTTSRRPC